MRYKYADELAAEYREDLKPVLAVYKFHNDRAKVYLTLSKECKENQQVELAKEFAVLHHEYKEVAKRLSPIISDTRYSISWLETARQPGNRNEISKRSYYQRTELWGDVDKVSMAYLREDYRQLDEEQSAVLETYLSVLSQREREAIVSVVGEGNTYAKTSEYMGVSRASVQTYVNRGMKKMIDYSCQPETGSLTEQKSKA